MLGTVVRCYVLVQVRHVGVGLAASFDRTGERSDLEMCDPMMCFEGIGLIINFDIQGLGELYERKPTVLNRLSQPAS